MTTTTKPPTFLDLVRDLTRRHEQREPYVGENGLWGVGARYEPKWFTTSSWSAQHTTEVPALVDQLLGAAPSGSLDQMGATFGSRPAARIEALDTVMLIDTEAGEWLDRLGEVIPADRIDRETMLTIRGSGTIRSVTKLGALHPSVTHCRNRQGTKSPTGRWCCPRHELERDVRHWWHQARIITGWDTPAFKPHNTCPVCGVRDSLRIRIDAALCVECRSIWEGADQLGVLARHILDENGDTQSA